MQSDAKPAEARATSGFPSPAEDVAESRLDLQALLVRRPAATYFLRMRGEAMQGAGVFAGDILVVDRSLRPTARRLIVLASGGELLVRRYLRAVVSQGVIFVAGGAGESEALALGDTADPANSSRALVWGVVTYVIHRADTLDLDAAGDSSAHVGRYANVQDVG